MSPLLPRIPRSSSDYSEQSLHRRASSPLTTSHLNISTLRDKLKPFASNLSAPEWMDRCSPDLLGRHSPCSPRSSFSPCLPLSPICPGSPDLPHSPPPPAGTNIPVCGQGEGCTWMMELLRGGLSGMGSVAELCQGGILHIGELLTAEGGSLSLAKKDSGGRVTLEKVIGPTSIGCLSDHDLCCNAHLEMMKTIMGCVFATGAPVNIRNISEVNLEQQLNVFMVHFVNSPSLDTTGKRLHLIFLLSKEHHSFEVLLSKMAATIMPFTHAQYCTIFIPKEEPSDIKDKISFSRVIHLECEELGSTYPKYALQTLVTMETLNVSQTSHESIKNLICCPVRNERSENVIAVCQLMNKGARDSNEIEAFNRYDERLLEDLAVYCGLALQYAQAVQITEERRASIEVTQEVLAYHITAAEQEIQALQEADIPSSDSLNILDFYFSDFGLPEDVTAQATVRMFLELNLMQEFNIDYKVSDLCQWVLTVKRGYRNNVPYHNWNHALSTAQSMFAMLMATDQLRDIFSNLEILALMIATLNHDLDHRGVTACFHLCLVVHIYLHLHSFYCVLLILSQGSQILSGLSSENHRTLLHMVKRAILATDLAVYMERRTEFFALTKKSRVNWKTDKQRDLLRSMLMTASDLSAISKPWPEQKRIANLVAMEFFAQGDKEKEEFKIKPIDIMNRENSTRLPYMQVEYIDEICYPLYKVCYCYCICGCVFRDTAMISLLFQRLSFKYIFGNLSCVIK
uniref:PDEase domain-containing protein n=1 Tax=Sphaeramia orbicularis TaxID=375764 RepID=A0A673AK61_9TELE